jgi:hypothetical protein
MLKPIVMTVSGVVKHPPHSGVATLPPENQAGCPESPGMIKDARDRYLSIKKIES